MRTFECRSVDEIASAITEIGPGALYRGQSSEYLDGEGRPNLKTSFERQGCIPPLMLKWSHAAKAILTTFVKGYDGASDLAVDQAILQHYGWRSFFLDASSNAAVAAWFAGHRYSSEPCGELIEDAFELPLMIRREQARYVAGDGEAVLYALSRKELRAQQIQAVDLLEIMTASGRPRYLAQNAFMIGPLQTALPPEIVVARIKGPAAAFREYAAQTPSMDADSLFPPPASDPVLAALLAMPWVRQSHAIIGDLGVFTRGLPLPEYHIGSVRRTGSGTAYYARTWIANAVAETIFQDTVFYLTEEALFHGGRPDDPRLPHLSSLLREHLSVAVEIDGLVAFPTAMGSPNYGKGIYLERQPDNTILLSGLTLKQRGLVPSEFGITRGVYYRVEDNLWKPVEHPQQCQCGNVAFHAHHLVVAAHFEHALTEGRFRKVRENLFADIDVDHRTDPVVRVDALKPTDGAPGA
ncbi:FRG domain-containing protein [Brevundimonas sp.]|uniref:FRG domain-containing protein n=1 Tax=Brevundimonas sp. TaxID=1871086 RepID=UPI002FC9B949